MDLVVLSVVCLTGLVLAAIAVARWGGERPVPPPLVVPGEVAPVGVTLRRLLRTLSIVVAAGLAAGVLTAGLGGRLMMRILAATSDDRVQGLTTEADETIGEITVSGTISVVVFVGVASGLLGGLVYVIIRRWLPGSARRAGLVLGGLAIGLAPLIDALDSDSADFFLLDPDLLSVVLIVLLFPLWGMTVASMIERADRSWPEPSLTPAGVAGCLPLLFFGAVVFLLPFVVAGVLAVLAAQRIGGLGRLVHSRPFDLAGRGLMLALLLVAVAWAGVNVVDILTGEDLIALR
jgi:hypothetical protein